MRLAVLCGLAVVFLSPWCSGPAVASGSGSLPALLLGQASPLQLETVEATVGSTAEKDAFGDVTLTSGDNGRTCTVRQGKSVIIRLPGDPTTGFAWEVAEVTGDGVRSRGDVVYEQPPKSSPGRAGTFVLKFRAAHASKDSTIRLVYIRPAEKDRPPARKFAATVKVR